MASLDGGPVRTSSGYAITPQHDASALAHAPTPWSCPGTQIPGPRNDGTHPRRRSRAALATDPTAAPGWSRSAPARSCSPRPGLLDGRPATTHWKYADELAALYPAVHVDAGRAVHRRRRRADQRRPQRRRRPLPAPDPPRPRQRGRQPRGAALRRTPVARRRSGAVHRAPRALPRRRVDGRRPARGRWSTSTADVPALAPAGPV